MNAFVNNVTIDNVKLDLAHVSNKHKITFEFNNKTFRSTTYNLVIQLNLCRKIEEISISTHGKQYYQYYMNKNCISNKKNLINLYSELISKSDDQDKSNAFHIQKNVNFSQQTAFTIKNNNEITEKYPYSWLFIYNYGNVREITLNTFTLTLKNIIKPNANNSLSKIASIDFRKSNKKAAIDWTIKNTSLLTPFLDSSNVETYRSETENGSWEIGLNFYTQRNEESDAITITSNNSEIGLLLPFYNEKSPININFELSADFLYLIKYKVFINYESEYSLMIGSACNTGSRYCVKVDRLVSLSHPRKKIVVTFNSKDLSEFMYNGLSRSWLESWLESKKRTDQ